jgi:hypothetical protein
VPAVTWQGTYPANTGGVPGFSFPSSVSGNGRYLLDQAGHPWLLAGDSPQPMIANIGPVDQALYFSTRASQGFNAAICDVVTDSYVAGLAGDAGTSFGGHAPFSTPGDLSTANNAYFVELDAMIRLAATYGITIILTPAETGGNMLSQANSSGPAKCTTYGTFLGNRYKSFPNIIWSHGNDFQTYPQTNINNIATGIRAGGDTHLQTVQLNFNISLSTDDAGWAALVDINSAYTYYQTYNEVQVGYNYATKTLPVMMTESNYDGMDNVGVGAHPATPRILRNQSWWTVLAGGLAGGLYGNLHWDFSGGWQAELTVAGAVQFGYQAAFLKARNFHLLVPDQAHSYVTAGYGTYDSGTTLATVVGGSYVTSALTPDGSLGLSYCPVSTTLTVAMSKMRGSTVARWYDPSHDTFSAIAGSPFTNTGTHAFATPGNNNDGDPDWVLVLEA